MSERWVKRGHCIMDMVKLVGIEHVFVMHNGTGSNVVRNSREVSAMT